MSTSPTLSAQLSTFSSPASPLRSPRDSCQCESPRRLSHSSTKPPIPRSPRLSLDHNNSNNSNKRIPGGLRRFSAIPSSSNPIHSSALVLRLSQTKCGLDRFPPHIITVYRRVFEQVDTTKRGEVSLDEINAFLCPLSRDRVDHILWLDGLAKPTLNFEQFVNVMTRAYSEQDHEPHIVGIPPEILHEYRKLFSEILSSRPVQSHSKHLDVEDLARGLGVSASKSRELFRQAEVVEDGLPFNSFVELLANEATDLTETPPPPPPME